MSRVVILGGGVAGLTAAFRRRWEAGTSETTVLEAEDRLGGAVRTVDEEGFLFEGGPNTLLTSVAAERLLAHLGLEDEVVAADAKAPRWIYRGGAPRAIVPGPKALLTKAITLGEKLRALKEPFIAPRPPSLEDESVHDFFLRRFGPGLARYAAGPIVSGVYADDPRTLSVRTAFGKLWEAEERGGSVLRGFMKAPAGGGPRPAKVRARTLNFRKGLRTLPEALASRLAGMGARVETGWRVAAVEGPLPGAGPRWRLVSSDGRHVEADRVLSTLDAPSLARLLGVRLPRSAPRLAALAYSRIAVVLQAWETTDPSGAPKGFGTLVPRGEGIRTLGILYPSSLFPGRIRQGVSQTTSFLGGALEPDIPALSDDDILALAHEEVLKVHPGIGRRLFARVVRWEAAIPRLPIRHFETLALLERDLAELDRRDGDRPSFLVTGPWRDGVALGDRIARGEEMGQLL